MFADYWQALDEGDILTKGDSREVAAELAEAAIQVFGRSPGNPLDDGGATTGFAAADGAGRAVACTVTMYKRFGAAKLSRRTGILFASNPRAAEPMGAEGIPLIAVNRPAFSLTQTSSVFYSAAVSNGGQAGIVALATGLAGTLLGSSDPSAALAMPRVALGDDGKILHEFPASEELSSFLHAKGYVAEPVPTLGHANLISCPGGLPDEPWTCRFRVDPRGYGIGVADGV
jgi:gamma-glutamyltranspeptidase